MNLSEVVDVDLLRKVIFLRQGSGDERLRRPYSEVAKLAGISEQQARDIVRRYRANPRPLIAFDPRTLYPALKEAFTDADVAAWQQHPTCLCGCGIATGVETSRNRRIPFGAPRLFHMGHYSRMTWAIQDLIRRNRTPENIAAQIATQKLRTYDCAALAGDIEEWLIRQRKSAAELSDLSLVHGSIIRRIRRGNIRAHPATIGRLQAAMRLPMREDVHAAYVAWMTRRGHTPRRVSVMR